MVSGIKTNEEVNAVYKQLRVDRKIKALINRTLKRSNQSFLFNACRTIQKYLNPSMPV